MEAWAIFFIVLGVIFLTTALFFLLRGLLYCYIYAKVFGMWE